MKSSPHRTLEGLSSEYAHILDAIVIILKSNQATWGKHPTNWEFFICIFCLYLSPLQNIANFKTELFAECIHSILSTQALTWFNILQKLTYDKIHANFEACS